MNNSLVLTLKNSKKVTLIGYIRGYEEEKTIYDWDEHYVKMYVPEYHLLMSYHSDCGRVRDPQIEKIPNLDYIIEKKYYYPEEGDSEKGIINREYFDDMGCHVPKGTPDVYPEVTVQMTSEDIERCLKYFLDYIEVSSIEELLQESDDEGEEEAPEYIQAE